MDELENELLPYEQSFRLKELGFVEKCFGVYLSGHLRFKALGETVFINDKSSWVAAPLYQQAFKFLLPKIEGKRFRVIMVKKNGNHLLQKEEEIGVWVNYSDGSDLDCIKKLIELCQKKG